MSLLSICIVEFRNCVLVGLSILSTHRKLFTSVNACLASEDYSTSKPQNLGASALRLDSTRTVLGFLDNAGGDEDGIRRDVTTSIVSYWQAVLVTAPAVSQSASSAAETKNSGSHRRFVNHRGKRVK
jgi:hypothetical protein